MKAEGFFSAKLINPIIKYIDNDHFRSVLFMVYNYTIDRTVETPFQVVSIPSLYSARQPVIVGVRLLRRGKP